MAQRSVNNVELGRRPGARASETAPALLNIFDRLTSIDDQQLRGREHFQEMRHAILGERQFHPAHQIEGGQEQQALARLGADQAQGDREMGFADHAGSGMTGTMPGP